MSRFLVRTGGRYWPLFAGGEEEEEQLEGVATDQRLREEEEGEERADSEIAEVIAEAAGRETPLEWGVSPSPSQVV